MFKLLSESVGIIGKIFELIFDIWILNNTNIIYIHINIYYPPTIIQRLIANRKDVFCHVSVVIHREDPRSASWCYAGPRQQNPFVLYKRIALETQGIARRVCLSTCLTVSTGQYILTKTEAIFQTLEETRKHTKALGLRDVRPRPFSFTSLEDVVRVGVDPVML